MDPFLFFTFLVFLYGILFFFDRFFKSCMHYPYDAFLKKTGITVQFMRIKWYTTAFNRYILKRGSNGSSCCRSWLTKSYTIGVFVALSLVPVGIILLFITIFRENSIDRRTIGAIKQSFNLEILLPGVNLPLDEIGYYVATLLFSTVIHELGHAIAAVIEDVPVTGFGFHLYFCLPLAYTELSAEHLNVLKWFKKLRILCAGIWHNVLFTGLCYYLLSTVNFTASPFYKTEENVIITRIGDQSPLKANGDKGLAEGNVITHINNCQVFSELSWYSCLVDTFLTNMGYCVSSDFIRLNDESIDISHQSEDGTLQCCDGRNLKVTCFEYIDDFSKDAPVEIPLYVCLDIRRTVEDAYAYCNSEGFCAKGFCLMPLLKNTTTIMDFKRQELHHPNHILKNVIYVGRVIDVHRTVHISPFVPKYSFISSKWCDGYVLFLKYNIVFSLGLALVNAIPCYGFDGHHIANTIMNSFLVNRVTEKPKRDVLSLMVTGIVTLLFIMAVTKVLWLSLLRNLF